MKQSLLKQIVLLLTVPFLFAACQANTKDNIEITRESSFEMPEISEDDIQTGSWTLISANGNDPVLSDFMFSFVDGELRGFDGCNRFWVQYTLTDNKLDPADEVTITAMRCTYFQDDEAIQQAIRSYKRILTTESLLTLVGDELTIDNERGQLVFRYQPTRWYEQVNKVTEPVQEEKAVQKARWVLLRFGGITANSAQNASFQIDEDRVSGQAGCYFFEGNVDFSGNAFEFNHIVETMTCDEEPDELSKMFLDLFEGTVDYRFDRQTGYLYVNGSVAKFEASHQKTIFVQVTHCSSGAKCLFVKDTEDGLYHVFDAEIIGFTGKIGYEYELLVAPTETVKWPYHMEPPYVFVKRVKLRPIIEN